MKTTPCKGGLTARDVCLLEDETEMRLHTCAECGRRNLYAIKDTAAKWVLEPHDAPASRLRQA